MDAPHVQVAIIGAGTAGLNARRAVLASGASCVLVDPGPFGTTCARIGCMPSKLLIAAAELAHGARNAEAFGVEVQGLRVDGEAVMQRVRGMRDGFVGKTVKGMMASLKEGELIQGHARFVDANTLDIEGFGQLRADRIIIATGSRPWVPAPYRGLGDRLLTNESVFELERPPESLLVIGAGAVGLELGQAFHRLGTRVTIVELDDRVGGASDPRVAAKARALFAQELDVHFHHAFHGLEQDADGVVVHFTGDDGVERRERYQYVLSAAGRRPRIEGLDLAAAGLDPLPPLDLSTGRLGTSHVFLAGDVSGERMLLHEAAHEGGIAGRNAARYPRIEAEERKAPLGIVFSEPQMARAGLAFSELDPKRHCVAEADFARQSRAKVLGRNEGLLRVYGDRHSGRLVGTEMVVPGAEHLAHLLAWAVQLGLSPEQALELPFYHPVLEEGVQSALRSLASQLRKLPAGADCPAMAS